jgi:MFS family permease
LKLSNVFKLYLYQAFSYAFFDRAIFAIYLSYQGVSLAWIGVLQGLLWVSTFVAEVPMGILGDRIGRKPLIIFGRASIAVYAVLMAAGGDLWVFVIAFLLFGLGEAAISGADISLLYESARDEGSTDDFSKHSGRFQSIASGSLSVAMLAGGLLQRISWDLVFLGVAALHIVTICIVLTVRETRSRGDEPTTFRAMAGELATAVRADRNLVAFVLGVSLFGASFITLFIYAPVLLSGRGFGTTTVSVVMTIVTGIGVIAGVTAWRVVRRTGDRLFFVAVPVACGALMFAMAGADLWLLAGLLLASVFLSDLLDPVTSRVLNDRVGDNIRASVMSLYSATFSLFAVILFPVAGWLGQQFSFGVMVTVLGSLCALAGLLILRGAALPVRATPAQEPEPAKESESAQESEPAQPESLEQERIA